MLILYYTSYSLISLPNILSTHYSSFYSSWDFLFFLSSIIASLPDIVSTRYSSFYSPLDFLFSFLLLHCFSSYLPFRATLLPILHHNFPHSPFSLVIVSFPNFFSSWLRFRPLLFYASCFHSAAVSLHISKSRRERVLEHDGRGTRRWQAGGASELRQHEPITDD